MLTVGYDSLSHLSQQKKTSGRRKDGSPSQPNVMFVVMNALVNVLVDEVFHCQNGDCQGPDDRKSRSLFVAMTKMMVASRQNSINHRFS